MHVTRLHFDMEGCRIGEKLNLKLNVLVRFFPVSSKRVWTAVAFSCSTHDYDLSAQLFYTVQTHDLKTPGYFLRLFYYTLVVSILNAFGPHFYHRSSFLIYFLF